MGAKPMHIRFDKVNGFIRVYDGTIYLVLFCEKCNFLYNRIRYLIRIKSGISYVIYHNHAKIKVHLYDSLKLLTFHNVTTLIKSVFNKGKNNHSYIIFLEKGSYELPNIFLINPSNILYS